jgi:hypothetical protein
MKQQTNGDCGQVGLLASELLEPYMRKFYGYGNPETKLWFIGMEEGGGGCFQEVERRIDLWHKRGRHAFEDVESYHRALGITENFEPQKKLQPTWAALIRTQLAATGDLEKEMPASVKRELVRNYQAKNWGQKNDLPSSCLLELFPLPKPKAHHWSYKNWVDLAKLPEFHSRESYMKSQEEVRIEGIRALVDAHKPYVIVCYSYSNDYLNYWKKLCVKLNCTLEEAVTKSNAREYCIAKSAHLDIYVIYHPSFHMKDRNAYFEEIGQHVGESLSDRICKSKEGTLGQSQTKKELLDAPFRP